MTSSPYHVRAVHCDHLASDEEVYAALKRATAPLTQAWVRLRAAKTIAIKINQDWGTPPRQIAGQFCEHVCEKVARAALRLLRENTRAELFVVDSSVYTELNKTDPGKSTWLMPVFREFDVEYVDGDKPPVVPCEVPVGGLMFRRYFMSQRLAEADAVVDIQKMKNHAYMGVTLCLKNLFGLLPNEGLARPHAYYHHLVRMPYMLADIGRILNPALNILDALVSQAGKEWDSEEARFTNALVAGDHVIATDACGTHLMGHNPQDDWLAEPFHRDRNALRVAAESGFGSNRLEDIDFQSEVQAAPPGMFFSSVTDPRETVISWRRTTAEQALYYRGHRQKFLDKYAGEYVLIQRGEVCWHDPLGHIGLSRRELAGDFPNEALFLKYVDPDEFEGEHFEIYEQTLDQIKKMGL